MVVRLRPRRADRSDRAEMKELAQVDRPETLLERAAGRDCRIIIRRAEQYYPTFGEVWTTLPAAGDRRQAGDLARFPDRFRTDSEVGSRSGQGALLPLLPLPAAVRLSRLASLFRSAVRAGYDPGRARGGAAQHERRPDQAQSRHSSRGLGASCPELQRLPGGVAGRAEWRAPTARPGSRCSAPVRWSRAGPATPPS